METIKLSSQNIPTESVDKIVKVLKEDGLVIMPTETVYGAFVDATNQNAVDKLNKYKQRPLGKPLSIAVADQNMAEKYADLNETAKDLYKNFLPGPLTVVSKGKGKLASGVESETGTLGIRIPDYKLILEVINKFKKPITATSANASYQKRPYSIKDVLDNLSKKQKGLIDVFVDVGTLPKNEPSTVIDTTLDDPAVLRQGDIKLKNKVKILSRSEEATQNLAKELLQKHDNYLGKRAIVFALVGPMGAGKTQFTKGLGKALNIKDEIVSPTYTLEEVYDNRLIHVDTWRIENPSEFEALGVKDKTSDNVVIAVEWADKVADKIREFAEDAIVIWVRIEYGQEDNERYISWGAL
jgi:L-threonylcarbamoyladenylate synthase